MKMSVLKLGQLSVSDRKSPVEEENEHQRQTVGRSSYVTWSYRPVKRSARVLGHCEIADRFFFSAGVVRNETLKFCSIIVAPDARASHSMLGQRVRRPGVCRKPPFRCVVID